MRKGNINTNDNVKKSKKSNIDKRKLASLIISVITIIVSLALVITLLKIGVLPFKYMIAVILGLLAINSVCCFVLLKNQKKKKVRNVINIIQVIFTLILGVVMVYAIKAYSALDNMTDDINTKKQNYSVLVLKDSEYNEIKDIDGKVVEYYTNSLDTSDIAINKLKEEVDVTSVGNEDMLAIGNDLLDEEVDAILIEDSQKLLLEEEIEGFADKVKVIHTFSIDIEVETIAKDASVTTDTFIVYISGIDTYGKISSVSRSDVNMIAVVNPKTYQVLLVNIPRDYYVQLHGTTGKRDKLTHAGMYGVEKSVQTIEDLLDIDINYYVKVNFTSVETIVDALGGIDVYSEYDFTSYKGNYKFKKGYNHMNGDQALCFARERKAFASGDRMRGKNQQAVIDGMIKQASKPTVITKVDTLLKTLSDKFQTNMETSKMMELVKLQISKMPTWNVSTLSLTGGDGRASTYSSGSQLLYVMYPSQNSIDDAKEKIAAVVAGETLEKSYDSVSGNIYTPTQAEATTAAPVVKEETKSEEPEIEEEVIDKKTTTDNNEKDNNTNTEKDNTTVEPYSEKNGKTSKTDE